MATLDVEEISPESYEDEEDGYLTEEPYRSPTRQERRYRRRRSPRYSEAPARRSTRQRRDWQDRPETREEVWDEKLADSQEKSSLPTLDYERAEFYKVYRDKAEEQDREFIGKYDEDLNNTLIFAGLFSAVTSAFITQVQPQLQPDSGDDTAALLRVLLYKIDNTTFGNDVPTLPQWTGPPSNIVQVQAILYASLVISLLAAFLAMLGKQWLNRYASFGTRGSAIERSQNRQRKHNGTVTWCFKYVMESLPLMLQGALFLLCCALSIYLWGIDPTVASVVVSLTSLGVISYGFIIVAGTVSADCPYQTPHARLLRYIIFDILPLAPSAFKSVTSSIYDGSESVAVLVSCWRELKNYRWLGFDCSCVVMVIFMMPIYLVIFPIYFLVLPTVMVYDVCLLVLAFFRALSDLAQRVSIWFRGARKSIPKAVLLDVQCISWILRASVDKVVHLLALKLLSTMTDVMDISPSLISACFDILIGCIMVVDHKAVVTQESEELAEVSANCCLRALSHLAATDPTLSTIKSVRRRYTRAFPLTTNFDAVPNNHSLRAIHDTFYSLQQSVQWKDYKILEDDLVILAGTLAERANKHVSETAQNSWDAFIRGRRRVKVPRWILRFALHYLSQDPPPPTSIVINCLSIIAIDLGCSVPLNAPVQDESILLEEISNLVTQRLLTMVESEDIFTVRCKRKAVTAFFPYAVWRERDGEHKMMEAFLAAAKVFDSTTLWHPIVPFIPALFRAASPQAVVIASPNVPWHRGLNDASVVDMWAAAISRVTPTEEVERRVVDALLQIASVDSLRPHIPNDSWSWLNRRPVLPPVCLGRAMGTKKHVVRRVKELGDVETLKSYLILVWSEWVPISSPQSLSEMRLAISRDLRGVEKRVHREELVNHLDHVLKQLDLGLGYLRQYNLWIDEEDVQRAKGQYAKLKGILQGLDEGETENPP